VCYVNGKCQSKENALTSELQHAHFKIHSGTCNQTEAYIGQTTAAEMRFQRRKVLHNVYISEDMH
jgi:hypothetical protein